MAVKTRDELLEAIRTRIGDDQSDEAIALIEDFSDTYDDLDKKAKGDGEDWKTKYEENDKSWRQKYRDRFFNTGNKEKDEEETKEEDEEKKTLSYDELFKEG